MNYTIRCQSDLQLKWKLRQFGKQYISSISTNVTAKACVSIELL